MAGKPLRLSSFIEFRVAAHPSTRTVSYYAILWSGWGIPRSQPPASKTGRLPLTIHPEIEFKSSIPGVLGGRLPIVAGLQMNSNFGGKEWIRTTDLRLPRCRHSSFSELLPQKSYRRDLLFHLSYRQRVINFAPSSGEASPTSISFI